MSFRIEEIQQDYLRANGPPHLRRARGGPHQHIAAFVMNIRVSIGSMLIGVGESIRRGSLASQEAVISPKSIACSEPVAEPVDSTVTA
ncbi:MAG: hypothetical protein H0T82_10345 [Sphingomonas sp.]|nr:hypothetical protein [Sphingomonas sp.]